jgi:hypothetical protein
MLTTAQIELLQRLIRSDRWWRTKKEKGEYEPMDYRGIEISPTITGVYMSTAQALVKAGLAEIRSLNGRDNWIFLGKYEPYDKE